MEHLEVQVHFLSHPVLVDLARIESGITPVNKAFPLLSIAHELSNVAYVELRSHTNQQLSVIRDNVSTTLDNVSTTLAPSYQSYCQSAQLTVR